VSSDSRKLSNREIEAARIGSTVGGKKRETIEEKARELSIRVLNGGTRNED
jgi:ribosomal protein L32E